MNGIKFIVRDPDKAYLGTQMWLPKRHINTARIKASLEFETWVDGEQSFLQLWEDSPAHLAVPREFVPRDEYNNLTFPIVDIRPRDFPRMDFKSRVILDELAPERSTQREAYLSFKQANNGLLNLSCGKGKTTLALHVIASKGYCSLIIVNQKTILDQWEKAIRKFLDFEGGIGRIQGSEWDWRRPITIATLQTLARYPDRVTPDMRRWFGVVIWDEVHHLSAPYFCITATMFAGHRYGLSATVTREDGTEVIYNYHLGEPFHKDLMQEVQPTIRFRETLFTIPPEDWMESVVDKRGNPNMSKLRTYVGQMEERNEYIGRDLMRAVEDGRKILALSHSKAQLKLMYQMFLERGVDCGICTGDQQVLKRWEALRDKQLVFGTHQLVLEAIDEESLDTLFWLTPFGSQHPEGGKNALQQGMGRIQGYRFKEGMKHPLVWIYDDLYIKHFHRMCNKLKHQLSSWPADEGGPYPYSTYKPLQEA
jgi:superfamily II DNA or RNA helicase